MITKVAYLNWKAQWAPGITRVPPLVTPHTPVLRVTLNGHFFNIFRPEMGKWVVFWMLLIELLSFTSSAGFRRAYVALVNIDLYLRASF